MLLSTTAVTVIINISLGIELSSSIPRETNASIGIVVSSCRYLNLKILLIIRNRKIVASIIAMLINICNDPFPTLSPKASAKIYSVSYTHLTLPTKRIV